MERTLLLGLSVLAAWLALVIAQPLLLAPALGFAALGLRPQLNQNVR